VPYSDATAAELRRALLLRSHDLSEMIGNLRGPLGRSRTFLRSALDLVGTFPDELVAVVEHEWGKHTDADSRSQILLPLLRHTNYVAGFVEDHLAHGTRRELSESLVDELHREMEALSLGQYGVVISHGEASNFTTKYGDLRRAIFGPLGRSVGSPELFALFKMPRIEGGGVQWRPVLLGHEASHVAVRDRDALTAYDLWSKFDVTRAGGLPNPKAGVGSSPAEVARGLYRIAEAWATELLCDAHALFRFGPAAISALAEYLAVIGAMDSPSATHPPGVLRLRLLLDQMWPIADPRLRAIVRPWADLTPAVVTLSDPWADYLASIFLGHPQGLVSTVASFGTEEYRSADRSAVVCYLSDRLKAGVPGSEAVFLAGPAPYTPIDADVVNAVWLARVEDSELPIDTLGKKALESLEFVRRWVRRGAEFPLDLYTPLADAASIANENEHAALSDALIAQRLRLNDDRRLVVIPLVHRPKGAGLDIRLGNRFIVFRRTGTASFDPLESEDDPRSIQVHLELSWNERFVLHPQEVVLGASLEYLVLPSDLTPIVSAYSEYMAKFTPSSLNVAPRGYGSPRIGCLSDIYRTPL